MAVSLECLGGLLMRGVVETVDDPFERWQRWHHHHQQQLLSSFGISGGTAVGGTEALSINIKTHVLHRPFFGSQTNPKTEWQRPYFTFPPEARKFWRFQILIHTFS